jgi:4-amino-4-deoxy-L-arabinose transferase-like glycosyltransferase
MARQAEPMGLVNRSKKRMNGRTSRTDRSGRSEETPDSNSVISEDRSVNRSNAGTPEAERHEASPAVRFRARRVDVLSAFVAGGIALVALLFTSPHIGITWDEGYTIRRDRSLDEWFGLLASQASRGGGLRSFDKAVLDRYWPFSREEPHGHPPLYALLGVAGWKLSHRWLPPLNAYRFGPMCLTAATTGLIYYHLARRKGWLAALSASVFFVLTPRVFAHAHYAHYDMPMTCLWLMAQMSFVASLEKRGWAIAYGILLGLGMGTKFTGVFAVAPALAWVVLSKVLFDRRGPNAPEIAKPEPWRLGALSLAIALPIAVVTLYAIQPPWWIEPFAGPMRFVTSNLTRAKTQPLATLYFGRVHEFSLPWHNTLVLTAITTPVAVQLLAALGIVACVVRRRDEPWALVWPLSWATLMIVRSLPNAPGHDGIRLFLPSIASLAILAGMGLAWLASASRWRWGKRVACVLAVAGACECVVGIARTYPYTDSYYNFAFGGLPAAEKQGFELTYYWETSGPEFLDWARDRSSTRAISLCFTMDDTNHKLLREWGELPSGIQILDMNTPGRGKLERPDFYVQQRRRGMYYPADRWLEGHASPVFAIKREGVDLLRVFTFEDFLEAARQTRDQPIPRHLFR